MCFSVRFASKGGKQSKGHRLPGNGWKTEGGSHNMNKGDQIKLNVH